MKILNCLCQQCKKRRAKTSLYKMQTRKVRRIMKQKLRYLVSKNQDIDLPSKYNGLFAA